MLRVNKVEGWLTRQSAVGPGRPALRTSASCVIIPAAGAGGSGPPPGARALRLHLVMIPPGTRGTAHFHAEHETAVYMVSGQAEVWHGPGLGERSLVGAGDFVYVPPGAPHLTVNRGDVTSVAVVARADPADKSGSVMVQIPEHLIGLLGIPVGVGE
ncbi:MAG TPA: cupin domain-containing protein [Trebonia sp.]